MSAVLLLTDHGSGPHDVLPALCQLPCTVRMRSRRDAQECPPADIVMVDARQELAGAKRLCRALRGRVPERPLIAVFTCDGLITLNPSWRVDDVVLHTAGADEIAMRLRMATERPPEPPTAEPLAHGPLSVDESTRTVVLGGREVDLTFTEFEILRCLTRRPGQIVTHEMFLEHLYGGAPRGSTRTIHTHIRRLRVKLGAEHATMIQSTHGVGYQLRPDT